MSMPVVFSAPAAPVSAPPGTGPGGGSGALFGDVLSGLTDDGGSSEDDTAEESVDAMFAAASAPLGGALLVGLNLPTGDARTLPGATRATGASVPQVAATPMGGTGVPTSAAGTFLPAPIGATAPGQPGAFAVPGQPTGVPVPGTPVPPGAAPAAPPAGATDARPAPAGTPSTVNTPTTQVPPASAAPVAAPAQAAAGAVAAAGLTGTLAGSVAGTAVAGGPPVTAGVAAPEPVARTVADTSASTVDAGVPGGTGSTVGTPVRSGNAFADTGSGQDRGEGALPRGPETGWAPTFAAARADSAAPATPAAPAPQPQLPPAAQLALRLAPLRTGPDGTHQLTILLNPDELGPVSVVATVKGDQLSVQLTGATEAGREAMRAALPQLERDLRDGGFATLALVVREAPQPEVVRPTWATPAATSPAQQAQPAAPTTPVAPTATGYATDGTATTTPTAKTDSQPTGQLGQPDGSTFVRRDDSTGQYNPAVAAAAQTPGPQFGNSGNGTSPQASQQSPQLNLGQPGGGPDGRSGQQADHPGFTDQHGGGRRADPGPDTPPPAGHRGPDEPDPRAAEHRTDQEPPGRPENRSVDLRV